MPDYLNKTLISPYIHDTGTHMHAKTKDRADTYELDHLIPVDSRSDNRRQERHGVFHPPNGICPGPSEEPVERRITDTDMLVCLRVEIWSGILGVTVYRVELVYTFYPFANHRD